MKKFIFLRKYFLFPIFILAVLIQVLPVFVQARGEKDINTFVENECHINVHYVEPDLLDDIQNNIPFEKALVVFDTLENRMNILYDSQGNDNNHRWLENIDNYGSPANSYFGETIEGNNITFESMMYGLRSVELVPCVFSYEAFAAPDAYTIRIPNTSFFSHRYFFVWITYFD